MPFVFMFLIDDSSRITAVKDPNRIRIKPASEMINIFFFMIGHLRVSASQPFYQGN